MEETCDMTDTGNDGLQLLYDFVPVFLDANMYGKTTEDQDQALSQSSSSIFEDSLDQYEKDPVASSCLETLNEIITTILLTEADDDGESRNTNITLTLKAAEMDETCDMTDTGNDGIQLVYDFVPVFFDTNTYGRTTEDQDQALSQSSSSIFEDLLDQYEKDPVTSSCLETLNELIATILLTEADDDGESRNTSIGHEETQTSGLRVPVQEVQDSPGTSGSYLQQGSINTAPLQTSSFCLETSDEVITTILLNEADDEGESGNTNIGFKETETACSRLAIQEVQVQDCLATSGTSSQPQSVSTGPLLPLSDTSVPAPHLGLGNPLCKCCIRCKLTKAERSRSKVRVAIPFQVILDAFLGAEEVKSSGTDTDETRMLAIVNSENTSKSSYNEQKDAILQQLMKGYQIYIPKQGISISNAEDIPLHSEAHGSPNLTTRSDSINFSDHLLASRLDSTALPRVDLTNKEKKHENGLKATTATDNLVDMDAAAIEMNAIEQSFRDLADVPWSDLLRFEEDDSKSTLSESAMDEMISNMCKELRANGPKLFGFDFPFDANGQPLLLETTELESELEEEDIFAEM